MPRHRPSAATSAPSRLQEQLAERIVELARRGELTPGVRLNELALARALNVSRTPVRAALAHLSRRGLATHSPADGFRLAPAAERARPAPDAPAQPGAEQRLLLAIARGRIDGSLPSTISEADLMRSYGASRPLVARVMTRLAELGVVERNPGYGWRFDPSAVDDTALAESYRFRLLVEPAALAEPAFALDPTWIAEMRARHTEAMTRPWTEGASIAFFEMNAAFHEGLAAASGNRFLLTAVQHQNRLRRFHNYRWRHGHDRVLVSSREHLEILDRIEAGELMVAGVLLRRHIERAAALPD